MSSVQNHDLTEYFLFLFFWPWFHISSRHIRRITLDINLEILLAVSKYSHLKSHNHLLFYRTVSQKFRRSLDVWFQLWVFSKISIQRLSIGIRNQVQSYGSLSGIHHSNSFISFSFFILPPSFPFSTLYTPPLSSLGEC